MAVSAAPVTAEFEATLRAQMSLIESELLAAVKADNPVLSEAAKHIIEAGGKRFRPQLLALGSRFGTPYETGGSVEAWQTIHDSPGLLDLWQIHYATANDAAHNTGAPLIANVAEPCNGDWIRLTAQLDGAFTVRNGRTGIQRQPPHRE